MRPRPRAAHRNAHHPYPSAYAHHRTRAYAYRNPYSDPCAHTDADRHRDFYSHPYPHAFAYRNPYPHHRANSHADRHCDSYSRPYSHAYADRNAYFYSHPYPHAYAAVQDNVSVGFSGQWPNLAVRRACAI